VIWRDRSLLGIVAAELVSLTGTAMTFVALPWFVLATTGSTGRMGWVLAAELLPVAIFGIPSGAVIARLGAKRTMLLSDAARAPLLAVVPVLHWTGHLSFGALLATTFAVGCFSAPYFSSSRLVIPEIVGEDEHRVAEANAILGGVNPLTQVLGPVLAGVLIAVAGPAAVLAVDGATYAVSFLTILLVVRAGRRVEQTEQSRGVLAGARFLLHDRLLGPLLVIACLVNFLVQGLIVGVDVLAYFHYESAHVLGFLFGAIGAGALLGALVAQQLTQKVDLLKLAAVAMALSPLPIWLLPTALPWAAAMLALALFGFFTPLVNAPIIAVLTVRTPPALRPKVMTAVMTIASLASPLGLVAASQALHVVSLRLLFAGVAALLTLAAAAFALVLLRSREPSSGLAATPA
jgi:MFS family permease